MRSHYTPAIKRKVLARWAAGEKVTALAKEFGVKGSGTLYQWRKDAGGTAVAVPETGKVNGHRDAIVFLRQARAAMGAADKLSKTELLALLALASLEGRL